MLDPDIRRVLDGTSITHLATLLPDGSPHSVPVWVAAHGDRIVFLAGPGKLKARKPPPRPPDGAVHRTHRQPLTPVVIRGLAIGWLEGDAAREIIDQLSMKYTGAPYSREQERVIARPPSGPPRREQLTGLGTWRTIPGLADFAIGESCFSTAGNGASVP